MTTSFPAIRSGDQVIRLLLCVFVLFLLNISAVEIRAIRVGGLVGQVHAQQATPTTSTGDQDDSDKDGTADKDDDDDDNDGEKDRDDDDDDGDGTLDVDDDDDDTDGDGAADKDDTDDDGDGTADISDDDDDGDGTLDDDEGNTATVSATGMFSPLKIAIGGIAVAAVLGLASLANARR